METLTGPQWTIYVADVRDGLAALPPLSVHTAVTSPPYWRLRDYGVAGQIGMERTPQEYIDNLASIFLHLAPVLRRDGVLWVNLGDTYCGKGGGGAGGTHGSKRKVNRNRLVGPSGETKIGELCLVPERFAIAAQQSGWWVRSRINWTKPNAMPESAPDRCGRDDEPLFMLSPTRRHYFDRLGVMFPASQNTHSRGHGLNPKRLKWDERLNKANARFSVFLNGITTERRCRTSWSIPTAPFSGNHFAAFPPGLVERCLKLTTSRGGCCPVCAAPFKRIITTERVPTRPGNQSKVGRASKHADSPYQKHTGSIVGNRDPLRHVTAYKTTGWEPSCNCAAEGEPTKPIVLDPFAGVCSTGIAALRLGCEFIGIELNPEYAQAGHDRLLAEWERMHSPKRIMRRRKPRAGERLLFDEELANA